MPYFKIAIEYGSEQEWYVKADSLEDAEGYAEDIEREVYISVEEVDEDLDDDTLDDNIATEEQ